MPTKPISIVHEITETRKVSNIEYTVNQKMVISVDYDPEEDNFDVSTVDIYENGAFVAEISKLLDKATGSPLNAIVESVDWKEHYGQTYNRKRKLKCWDAENERWIFQNEDNEFTFKNGKWTVKYTEEINIKGNVEFPAERDVPVLREVENPIVVEY